MSAVAPSPQLALEQVLEVFLICFDAVAAALPPFLLAYAVPCQIPELDIPVWMLWDVRDLHDPPEDIGYLSFPPEGLIPALAKKDMCDWFCFLMQGEVDRKLQEIFGASAHWLQCHPRISFLLATRGGAHQLELPAHSALLIVKPDGKRSIMDGTLEQFGWPRETWLQAEKDFVETKVNTEQLGMGLAPQGTRESVGEAMLQVDRGYWAVAYERMMELFGELDWEELRGLGSEERVERVKKQAEEKFAGTHEEACERFDSQHG